MPLPVILMLEHDEDDRYLTQHIFLENGAKAEVGFVRSSDELFEYLAKAADMPSLFLLTQQSTPLNALEVLKYLKSRSQYQHIPVIVLGETFTKGMIKEYYAAGAGSVIRKPPTHQDTKDKIGRFLQYWFATVELP